MALRSRGLPSGPPAGAVKPVMVGAAFLTTTENLVLACWRILAPKVAPARLAKLKLWETENHYVEYQGR